MKDGVVKAAICEIVNFNFNIFIVFAFSYFRIFLYFHIFISFLMSIFMSNGNS